MASTLVFFHAHPDDEAISTGGVMAKAAGEGHRVVLVVATRGELGEVVAGTLAAGEHLWERRVAETHRSAEILGVSRVEFLGYTDSGMQGEPSNDADGCFWQADVDEAARRLAVILQAEDADLLTVYDETGTYGHPDHVQVHRVGVRAAELAGTARVYEASANRDRIERMLADAAANGIDLGATGVDPETEIGVPEASLTTQVDVRAWVGRKRDAMRAHASQIAETSFFLAMPDPVFDEAFGVEWFTRRGHARIGDAWETELVFG